MENKLKLYDVDFTPMYPVGGHLYIFAESLEEASKIANDTVKHTKVESVREIKIEKGVMSYESGDY